MPDDYDFLKNQYDEVAAKDLRRRVAEWANSPEGEHTFKQIAAAIQVEVEQIDRVRRELYLLMQKPITL